MFKILENNKKEKQFFLIDLNKKTLSLKFSVKNDSMKDVESFAIVLFLKIKE